MYFDDSLYGPNVSEVISHKLEEPAKAKITFIDNFQKHRPKDNKINFITKAPTPKVTDLYSE